MDISLLHYLYFNSSKQITLNYLNQCKCCIRHQNNNPYIYNNINLVTNNKKRKRYEIFVIVNVDIMQEILVEMLNLHFI